MFQVSPSLSSINVFFYATPEEKCKITEVVISQLSLLDRSSITFKGLIVLHQMALNMKVNKQYKTTLEGMIGAGLDQATVDYLLVPSPRGKKHVYDVNLVLRLGISFLNEAESCHSSHKSGLTNVAELMDLYLAAVAPDSRLSPTKFVALARMLPDSARSSHDRLYQAIALYFKRHTDLYEHEKLTICCALNCNKLSGQASKQVSRDPNFPSRRAVEAFKTQQSKLRSILQEVYNIKTKDEKEEIESVLLNAERLDIPTEAHKLRSDLHRMHSKAMELRKVFRTMQIQVRGVIKSKLPFRGSNTVILTKTLS